jgi:hypothetical protein
MNISKATQVLLVLTFALATSWSLLACTEKVPEPEPKPRPAATKKETKPPPKELVKEDLKVGDGPTAEKGDRVEVHYTGRLHKNNKKFDSSRDKKKPFPFTIGQGDVIKGWDQGVVGMKVGGRRKLTIPSDLAYGDKGQPPKIPPKAALVFDIELLKIEGKSSDDEADDKKGEDAETDKKADKKADKKKGAAKD